LAAKSRFFVRLLAAYREFMLEFRSLVRIEIEGHPGMKTKVGRG